MGLATNSHAYQELVHHLTFDSSIPDISKQMFTLKLISDTLASAGLQIRVHNFKYVFLFINQRNVGTPKNRLNERVLLSTKLFITKIIPILR